MDFATAARNTTPRYETATEVPDEPRLVGVVSALNASASESLARIENIRGMIGLPMFPSDPAKESSDSLRDRLGDLSRKLNTISEYLIGIQNAI